MGFDLVIRNGTIVDGSGAARYRGDLGITEGRIVEIGRIRAVARRTIDADGLIVAPGFIEAIPTWTPRWRGTGSGAAPAGTA